MNRTLKRLAIPVGAAAILGTSGFAFMASNQFDHAASFAGDGAQTISGYVVSNVHYDVVKHNGYWINGVTFDLNQAASAANMKVNVYDPSGHAYDQCTSPSLNNGSAPAGSTWTCVNPSRDATSASFPGDGLATPAGANRVQVVAAQ